MKRFFLILIVFGSINFCLSQQIITKPDYKKIEKEISNKKSRYFYENLFERFMKSDTTFTSIENHYLYYGYSFNKNYNPYNRSEKFKDLDAVLSVEDKNKIDFDKALKISEEIINAEPFNMRVYNVMLYILDNKKDKLYFDKIYFRMKCIIDAILKSGDGRTEETPLYVIEVSHEYDILNIIGFEYGGEQSLSKSGLDYLKLKENKVNLKGLYFDVSPSFNFLQKSFK